MHLFRSYAKSNRFWFLSSAKRVNNRESNITRGWSYSQQSNLYLKKAALYSLENPRILWSCQPLISKGSLADRDLNLSYGAREVWFWHQICRYYTVCHHVEAYILRRLSIDSFSFERVAQSNLEWIFSKLDSGFQSLVGFRIPSAGFRIPKLRIPDSTSKKIPGFRNPDSLTWGDKQVTYVSCLHIEISMQAFRLLIVPCLKEIMVPGRSFNVPASKCLYRYITTTK